MQEIQERPQAGDGEATALSVARLPRALCSLFSVLCSLFSVLCSLFSVFRFPFSGAAHAAPCD